MAGLPPFELFSLISNVLLAVLTATTKSEFCGSYFEAHVDHALVGHVMGRSTVTSDFECLQKCIRKISCKSCNVHLNGTYTSRICELKNQTQHMKSSDLMRKEGSTYYGIVQVSCNPGFHEDNTTKNVTSSHEGSLAPVLGWNSSFPAQSCKHIRDVGGSKGNGEYWIDPGSSGNPLKVYCDMTTDEGGWLLIYNVIIDNSRPPTSLDVETSYTGINRYKNGKMVISPDGLRQLRKNFSFTQLRFHCRKQYHGRTFHVKTAANSSGQAVVRFFSGDTDVFPEACGSFEKLQGDNSELASRCAEWGKEKNAYYVGKWGHEGHKELHINSAFILSTYHWITSPDHDRWECDDVLAKHMSNGDFWKIYVR